MAEELKLWWVDAAHSWLLVVLCPGKSHPLLSKAATLCMEVMCIESKSVSEEKYEHDFRYACPDAAHL